MNATGNRLSLRPSSDYLSPLPSVLVSCRGIEPPYDKDNLIAIARAAPLTTEPPMVCISVKDERFSYHQIKQSKEYVVNLVGRELCLASDWCGVRSGRDYDKFAECGLTAVPIGGLAVARALEQSPLSIGCRLVETVERAHYAIFIGEIVSVEARQECIGPNGRLDLSKSGLVYFSSLTRGYFDGGESLGAYGYSVATRDSAPKPR